MKKVTNLVQNFAKNGRFKFAPKHWSSVLFPDLNFDVDTLEQRCQPSLNQS